jgi:hypothetical protein
LKRPASRAKPRLQLFPLRSVRIVAVIGFAAEIVLKSQFAFERDHQCGSGFLVGGDRRNDRVAWCFDTLCHAVERPPGRNPTCRQSTPKCTPTSAIIRAAQSIPRRHNAIVQHLEVTADAEALYLRLNQPFRWLKQALLHLTNADRERARIDQAPLDQQLAEEVWLSW